MSLLDKILLILGGWLVGSLILGPIIGHVLRHGTLRGLLRRGSR